jgi:hypothetical protein
MPTFLVERYLDGWSPERLDDLVQHILRLSRALDAAGVIHLGTVVIPIDECCLSIFESSDVERVRRANEQVDPPCDRITEVSSVHQP